MKSDLKKDDEITMERKKYFDIVKREKRISYIFTFAIPILLYALIFYFIISIDIDPENSEPLALSLVTMFLYVIAYMVVYIPKRSDKSDKKSSKAFFQKIGFEKMVIREEILYKINKQHVEFFIFAVALSSVMLGVLIFAIDSSDTSLSKEQEKIFHKMQFIFYSIPIVPGIMVYTYYLSRNPLARYPDYRLFSSIACFKIIRNCTDISDKENVQYTIIGLKHYNEFLRKNLKITINDIEKFYTKLLLDISIQEHTGIILSKLENSNKLELLKYLTSLLSSDVNYDSISASSSRSVKSVLPFIVSVIASLIAAGIVIFFQSIT